MPAITLFVYLGVIWWSTWYPGAEPGGGGYVAQRIFSAKNERHGLLATLWFNVAHYALRPWPWILTALASLILYPNLVDKESGYIQTLMDPNVFPDLPARFHVGGVCSRVHVDDRHAAQLGRFLRHQRFLPALYQREASEKHYVIASQVVTVLLMIVSLVVTFYMESIGGAWKLLLVTGAGTGTVLLLRWFWWRINAWSEVSAMITAAVVSIFLQLVLKWDSDQPRDFAYLMLVTVGVTSLVWIVVTMLTQAEPMEKLIAFYRRVRPEGPGWNDIAARSRTLGITRAGPALAAVCKLDTRVRVDLRFLVWYRQVDIQGVGDGSVILGYRDCGRGAYLAEPLARRDDRGDAPT